MALATGRPAPTHPIPPRAVPRIRTKVTLPQRNHRTAHRSKIPPVADRKDRVRINMAGPTLWSRAVEGAVDGSIAVIPMTMVFWGARVAGLLDEVPPHKAMRSLMPERREPELSLLSGAAHIAVGASLGSAFTVLDRRPCSRVAAGLLFGMGAWLVGYEVVMPATTDIAPAHRDRRARALVIFIAHIVYGYALGSLRGRRENVDVS